MNILHLSMGIGPTSFGVSRAILNLVKRQIEAGHQVNIWSFESEEGIDWACSLSGIDRSCIKTFNTVGPRSLFYSPDLEQTIKGTLGTEFDVLHQHAVWGLFGRATCRWNRVTGKPFVVSPHGAMEPYYYNRGRLKKQIAGVLYANYLFHHAKCMHACSFKEYESIRAAGVACPVAVIPNGIDDIAFDKQSSKPNNNPPDRKRMLFLSRVVPEKGLEILLDAIALVPDFRNEWLLVIAGDGDKQFLQLLQTKVEQLNLSNCVHFAGFVDGDEKSKFISSSNLFILPSYSENFGVAIAEALLAGVPAITTTGTPWSDLVEHKCGWWVNPDVRGLVLGVTEAITTPFDVLREMGMNGRKLVKKRYTLERCGDMSIEMYKWMLINKEKPDFLYCVDNREVCGIG